MGVLEPLSRWWYDLDGDGVNGIGELFAKGVIDGPVLLNRHQILELRGSDGQLKMMPIPSRVRDLNGGIFEGVLKLFFNHGCGYHRHVPRLKEP